MLDSRAMSEMRKTDGRRATYEDLAKVPDPMVAELLDGELVVSPRPGSRHARTASTMGSDLLGPFDRGLGGPGGWWILDEPEVHLGGDVLVPDLAGWRRERMPAIPDVAAFSLSPDWVAEVVSPGTARHDRVVKLAIYAREQVQNVWLVDPIARVLEVYRLQGGRWLLVGTHGGDAQVRAEPFEALELSLAAWWID